MIQPKLVLNRGNSFAFTTKFSRIAIVVFTVLLVVEKHEQAKLCVDTSVETSISPGTQGTGDRIWGQTGGKGWGVSRDAPVRARHCAMTAQDNPCKGCDGTGMSPSKDSLLTGWMVIGNPQAAGCAQANLARQHIPYIHKKVFDEGHSLKPWLF